SALHRARHDRGAHGGDQALSNPPVQDGAPPLQALDRAFAVLDLFGAERPEWGTSEVARAAGLPVPTAHRILAALTGRRYLAREGLCRATITDAEPLRANLAEVRARGWAISFEETNVGVWGVAVPLLDEHGVAVAALGLAGPSARLSPEEVVDHLERLRDAAL